jgi:hypothetical protein
MSNELSLRSGYVIESSEATGGDELRLRAPDGRVCLKIKLTAEGPEVELTSVALSIATKGEVSVACDRFSVVAKECVSIVSGGDLKAQAVGAIETEAHAQRHRARRGDIALVANDDVSLDGERIRLNSPRPLAPVRRPPTT